MTSEVFSCSLNVTSEVLKAGLMRLAAADVKQIVYILHSMETHPSFVWGGGGGREEDIQLQLQSCRTSYIAYVLHTLDVGHMYTPAKS